MKIPSAPFPKKPVLIRVPQYIYDQLLVRSAMETVIRNKSLSVPSLVVELIIAELTAKSKV